MKRIIMAIAVILMAGLLETDLSAQNNSARNDSIANTLKLNSLKKQKERLQKEISTQDAKRNRNIPGVVRETMELMNERQDSLCLALRSKLVDVALEIKELSPSLASPTLINQFNNLMNGKK